MPHQPAATILRSRRHQVALAALASLLAVTVPAPGAGLWLYERGTPDNGMSAAGRAASALDASTAGGNPAGMTRLTQPELLLGLQPMYVDARFGANGSTNVAGDNGGNAGGFIPAGGFNYVQPLSENWRFGLSAGSYFGLGEDFGDTWVGRYYLQDASLTTFSLSPVAAYKVNDWLSIGGGPVLMLGQLSQHAALRRPGAGDGQLVIKSETLGVGGGAGVLVEPVQGTRFGLTYMSPIDLNFNDVIDSSDPSSIAANNNLDLDMTIPQAVMFSVYQDITKRWAVMGNLGWQDWSEFGNTDFSVAGRIDKSGTVDLNYDDTYHVALGTKYAFTDEWAGMCGIAYDTSPVDDENRTLALPLSYEIRYSVGLEYKFTANQTIGLAYTLVDCGTPSVTQSDPVRGTVSGEFGSSYLHIATLTYDIRF
ncbi:MAG: outer membrane protein transport protein [Lentisphaeria bacterium]